MSAKPACAPRAPRVKTPALPPATDNVVRFASRNQKAIEAGFADLSGGVERHQIQGFAYVALVSDGTVRFGSFGNVRQKLEQAHYGACLLSESLLHPENFVQVKS